MILIIRSSKNLTEFCIRQNPNLTKNVHKVFLDFIFPKSIINYADAESVLTKRKF